MTHNLGTLGCGPGPYDDPPTRPATPGRDLQRLPEPSKRDYKDIGCALCRRDVGWPGLVYMLPPPWGSLDARDDVRLHHECYRILVWEMWTRLGFVVIPPGFIP